MFELAITDIVTATAGRLVQRGKTVIVRGVSTDSRTIKPGELFVAVPGPRFDGHHFCAAAVASGASGVLVSRSVMLPQDIAVIEVADTIRSLGALAHHWRQRFTVPCVAITGSNGKSTTKEMTAAVVSALGPVLKTTGNFNNLIGLPLTIFGWNTEHRAAVLEMGMNAAGEIAALTTIARPQVGLITNVTAAHLEQLGTVAAVAAAKGELFATVGAQGTAVVNVEDPWVMKLGRRHAGRIIRFGMQNDCDVQLQRMEANDLTAMKLVVRVVTQPVTFRLPVVGTHYVMNALAALAVGVALSIDAEAGAARLETFSPLPMRFERIQLANGVRLINDAYNANPDSMIAALRTIASAPRAGKFIAVLGDMLELGTAAAELHEAVGKEAAALGVERLLVFGDHAADVIRGARAAGLANGSAMMCDALADLEATLLAELKAGDVLLIKGSRGMKMERIVEHLKQTIGCG